MTRNLFLCAAVLSLIQPALAGSHEAKSHPSKRPLSKALDRGLTRGPAYCVDPAGGDDENDGSIKTIQHGVHQLKPGDMLYLRGVVYRERDERGQP